MHVCVFIYRRLMLCVWNYLYVCRLGCSLCSYAWWTDPVFQDGNGMDLSEPVHGRGTTIYRASQSARRRLAKLISCTTFHWWTLRWGPENAREIGEALLCSSSWKQQKDTNSKCRAKCLLKMARMLQCYDRQAAASPNNPYLSSLESASIQQMKRLDEALLESRQDVLKMALAACWDGPMELVGAWKTDFCAVMPLVRLRFPRSFWHM